MAEHVATPVTVDLASEQQPAAAEQPTDSAAIEKSDAAAAAPVEDDKVYPEEECKVFIGGVSWDTSEEKLHEHFGQFGAVRDCTVLKDKMTGKPRGFGFVTFKTPAAAQAAVQNKSP